MNKTSKRKPKNNAKMKASGDKDDHKGKDIKNAVKPKLNKVIKKPRNVSNKWKNINRNTAWGSSKGYRPGFKGCGMGINKLENRFFHAMKQSSGNQKNAEEQDDSKEFSK